MDPGAQLSLSFIQFRTPACVMVAPTTQSSYSFTGTPSVINQQKLQKSRKLIAFMHMCGGLHSWLYHAACDPWASGWTCLKMKATATVCWLGVDKHSPWRGGGVEAETLTENCAGNGRVVGHPQVGIMNSKTPADSLIHCGHTANSLVSRSTTSRACLSKKQPNDSQRQLLPFVWVSGCRAGVSRKQGRSGASGESGLEHSSPKGADYSYSGNLWGVCA